MKKRFTQMSKREAYSFIFSTAEKLNEILDAYDFERRVFSLVERWNKANPDEYLDVYPYYSEGFNEGMQCGIALEDEYIIFKSLEEEWNNQF